MPNEAPIAPAADAQTILDAAGGTPPGGDKPNSGAPNANANGQPATPATPAAGNPDPSKDAKPGDAKPNDTPQGAPEKYADFKLPDGIALDSGLADKFKTVAKELNLPQEAAQKLVDLQVQSLNSAATQAANDFKQLRSTWQAETKKALGANAQTELSFAAKARDQFASPALKTLLQETGLGDHPEVVKLFVSLGKAVAEDGLVDGKPSAAKGEKSTADVLYGGGSAKK